MQLSRPPAVAGTFYPGAPGALQEVVDRFLEEAADGLPELPLPKAIVAPHAGYVYSGPVAASAYAALRAGRGVIRRVVLLGPSHRVPVLGLATTRADVFLTPLGSVPIDQAGREIALGLPQVHASDEAHAYEHSLEVHLPFLQRVLGSFTLIPFSVGDASAEDVAEVLEALWGGPETLIVVSSDLSHYYDYETARRLDAATTHAIESLDPGGLDRESACGRVPVRGLLLCARRHGLEVRTLDVRSSGDTAGPRDRVVGYGAWGFWEPARPRAAAGGGDAAKGESDETPWEPRFDAMLLELARRSIELGARTGRPLEVDPSAFPPPLREVRSSFVTLELDGQLRGCVGSLEAHLPLVCDVARSAYKAAYEDPRFAPVTEEERPRLELHVSVLEPAVPLPHHSEAALLAQLRPGVDGLILKEGRAYATFLPDVWKSLPEPRAFLAHLKRKAGLPPDYWSESVEVYRYRTRSIG